MTTTSRTVRSRRWWPLWGLMALSAIGIAGYAVPRYLTGDPADVSLPLNPEVPLHYLSLVMHALPGGLALVIGPFQFLARLRAGRPGLHRIMGRIYMISVLAASVASIFAATFTLDGFPVQVAFYLLVAAWLYSLVQAYRSIRRGDVRLHRIWMIRNYALTFAAVTLRVYLMAGLLLRPVTGLTFDDVYTASAWASFLINAVVAEYFIVQRTLAPAGRLRSGEPAPATTTG
ncbi:hypothetical protein Ssi03_37050 [Sphaerisporangium siamense]|uniref:Putative membrane protein n=1 Tax=Sphaerisporangium siamense TaxID=795645 RepID=A0A7W7GAB3_9ACTN|nr:DUF2306 domain-containing protein [Sphaerisporangium siamense]MBB4701590.1 putative membrane protein [Sphaerisporangium siamense]GII85715.1 hypothetical protein Ssi03_37050 [Sphaerisporangium siamense]